MKNKQHEKGIYFFNAGNDDVSVDGCEMACFRYDSTALYTTVYASYRVILG